MQRFLFRVPSARARLSFAQTKLRRVNRRESAPLVLLVRAEALCPSPIFAKTDVGHRMSYIYQRFAGVCPATSARRRSLIAPKPFSLSVSADFLQGFRFYLADALTRDAKLLSYFFQCVIDAVFKPVAHGKNFPLFGGQVV